MPVRTFISGNNSHDEDTSEDAIPILFPHHSDHGEKGAELDSKPSQPAPMLTFNAEDIIGKSFLVPRANGEMHRARCVKALADYD